MEPIEADQIKEAFKKYYEQYHYAVYRRFLKRLSRYHHSMKKEQAEDFLQDTFFGLFRWMQKYWEENRQIPPPENTERVLYKIEINKYFNYYHKYLKPTEDVIGYLRNGRGSHPENTTAFDPPIPNHQRPDQRILHEELLEQVAECLENELEPYQKAALLCRAMGYSYKDIAAIIDEDEAKIAYSILPLARKKLRKCMGAYIYGNRKR